jgi:hypothetical protein
MTFVGFSNVLQQLPRTNFVGMQACLRLTNGSRRLHPVNLRVSQRQGEEWVESGPMQWGLLLTATGTNPPPYWIQPGEGQWVNLLVAEAKLPLRVVLVGMEPYGSAEAMGMGALRLYQVHLRGWPDCVPDGKVFWVTNEFWPER